MKDPNNIRNRWAWSHFRDHARTYAEKTGDFLIHPKGATP